MVETIIQSFRRDKNYFSRVSNWIFSGKFLADEKGKEEAIIKTLFEYLYIQIVVYGGNVIMILCFSGTGNSRYIAGRIAGALQDKVVDLNAKIKALENRVIILNRQEICLWISNLPQPY